MQRWEHFEESLLQLTKCYVTQYVWDIMQSETEMHIKMNVTGIFSKLKITMSLFTHPQTFPYILLFFMQLLSVQQHIKFQKEQKNFKIIQMLHMTPYVVYCICAKHARRNVILPIASCTFPTNLQKFCHRHVSPSAWVANLCAKQNI